MAKKEVIEQFDPSKAFPIITYGLPYDEACAKHLKDSLKCSKPFIIFSGSMSRETDAIQRLTKSIGKEHIAGTHNGMKPHTYYSEVLEIMEEIKSTGADCIITVGGGSLIDGAKGMAFVGPILHRLCNN